MARSLVLAKRVPGSPHPLVTALYRETGVSLRVWGKLSGLHFTTIARYVKGRRAPSLDHLQRLAEGLGVGIEIRLKGLPRRRVAKAA